MTMLQGPGQLQGIAPLVDALQKIQDYFVALKRKNLTASDIMPLLVEGWDFTKNPLKVDEPSSGVWRASHVAIVKKIDLLRTSICAILSPGMSVAQLQAGLWRQLRVFPINEAWRRSAVDQAAHADLALAAVVYIAIQARTAARLPATRVGGGPACRTRTACSGSSGA